jgi:hypothetical protein
VVDPSPLFTTQACVFENTRTVTGSKPTLMTLSTANSLVPSGVLLVLRIPSAPEKRYG